MNIKTEEAKLREEILKEVSEDICVANFDKWAANHIVEKVITLTNLADKKMFKDAIEKLKEELFKEMKSIKYIGCYDFVEEKINKLLKTLGLE